MRTTRGRRQASIVLGLETDDLAGERKRLTDAGVAIVNEMDGSGPVPAMFAINDPDGNWLWIVQRSA